MFVNFMQPELEEEIVSSNDMTESETEDIK